MATTLTPLRDAEPKTLDPDDPRIKENQATLNIGTIGHVAHGKSTIVRSISDVQTVRFKNERERNITIKLGYANAKIYKCQNPKHEAPSNYLSKPSSSPPEIPCPSEACGGTMTIERHVSFVDCPGHDILMATMLNGAAVMDAALLLVAGNESCPQPQTSEHLAAVELMQLRHLIILQNKVELITKQAALTQHAAIKQFAKGTVAEDAPIIPVSAVLKYNLDVLCEYLCTQIPYPVRDFVTPVHMIVIRSFDVNKPGQEYDKMVGGVAGGSILKGILRIGDEVEFRPGIVTKDPDNGEINVRPLRSKVVSLYAEQNDLEIAVPGGLIGVGLQLDPAITRGDKLVGNIMGASGTLPSVYIGIQVSFYLLRRLLGVKGQANEVSIDPLKKGELLAINIGSSFVTGKVIKINSSKSQVKIDLTMPVCTTDGDKVAISRKIEKNWRLIGWGSVQGGKAIL